MGLKQTVQAFIIAASISGGAIAQESPKVADNTAHQVAVVLADATPTIQSQAAMVVATAKAWEADLKKGLDTTAKPGQVAVTIITPAWVTPPVLSAVSLGAIKVEALTKTVDSTTNSANPEVTLKDGSKMSFTDLAKMGTRGQDAIIEQISDDDADRFEKFIRSTQLQVANQQEKQIDGNIQVANQQEKQIDGNIQAANQRIETKKWVEQAVLEDLAKNAKELESTIRIALKSGIKLPAAYRETMNTVISFWKPPETIKYFEEVLANPTNFSV
jgi:hypothetical protein